jgi:phage baseplate assembly protein V
MATLAPPRVVVEVGGRALPPALAASISEVRVHARLAAPSMCEIVFLDPPTHVPVLEAMPTGATIRVAVEGSEPALFDGHVTAVEAVFEPWRGREVRVRGYDALQTLRTRQRPRVFVAVTPRALAEELVGDLGLTVNADQDGPLHERLIQHRQSDLELLLEVCERSGLYPVVEARVLRLVTLGGSGSPIPLQLGETLLEARIEVNADAGCGEVSVLGWDPGVVQARAGQASGHRIASRTAAALLADEQTAGRSRQLLDEAAGTIDHATALAQAELDARASTVTTLTGIAVGDPRLSPGSIVSVGGVGVGFAGDYALTGVDHLVDRIEGYRSRISTAAPSRGQRDWPTVATPGTVTSVADPDGLGRIQVTLPTFGDVETPWLGVVAAGAGAGKGLVALPDAGDQVLVLLAHGDPARGVVIGGLYGSGGPPDTGIEGGQVRRYTLITTGGHSIRLDDEAGTLRLEDPAGSTVELGPEQLRIHAATELLIEAPGRGITIRGASVDFETG